jgi:hypothetical protein
MELYIHFPNTPSWRGAQLTHRDNFTFYLYLTNMLFLSFTDPNIPTCKLCTCQLQLIVTRIFDYFALSLFKKQSPEQQVYEAKLVALTRNGDVQTDNTSGLLLSSGAYVIILTTARQVLRNRKSTKQCFTSFKSD